jgi:hypothetical protein
MKRCSYVGKALQFWSCHYSKVTTGKDYLYILTQKWYLVLYIQSSCDLVVWKTYVQSRQSAKLFLQCRN